MLADAEGRKKAVSKESCIGFHSKAETHPAGKLIL